MHVDISLQARIALVGGGGGALRKNSECIQCLAITVDIVYIWNEG